MTNWRNWREWKPFRFGRHDTDAKMETKTEAMTTTAGQSRPMTDGGSTPMRLADLLHEPLFMDPFFTDPTRGMSALDRWFGDFRPAMFSPTVDVTDEGKILKVTAELPGMEKDDVKLAVEDGHLVIRGEKRNEEEKNEEGCYRLERSWGSFQRTLPLPGGLDFEHPKAAFANGVLTVRFHKVEEPGEKAKSIPIG